jgi:hypothetical protein
MIDALPGLRGGLRLSVGLSTRSRAFQQRAPAMLRYQTVCTYIDTFVAFVQAEPSVGTIAGTDGRSQVNRVFSVIVS